MLWLKALHIIFMVTWFAGLFYLPRLFVYHADCTDPDSNKRFNIMERKLFAIMTFGAILAAIFGAWLLAGWHWPVTALWLKIKLLLVGALVAYHVYCGVLVKRFAGGENRHSAVFYRWFNEFPVLILIAVVLLAVLRPT